MENKFIVNIIHRPELSPEYAERALGKGEGVRDESMDIFRFQQDCAHKYGLKTTIQITYASLFSEEIIRQANREAEAIREKASADIAREKKQAVSEAKNEISSLAMEIAGKVVGQSLDAARQEQLVDSFLEELGEQQ